MRLWDQKTPTSIVQAAARKQRSFLPLIQATFSFSNLKFPPSFQPSCHLLTGFRVSVLNSWEKFLLILENKNDKREPTVVQDDGRLFKGPAGCLFFKLVSLIFMLQHQFGLQTALHHQSAHPPLPPPPHKYNENSFHCGFSTKKKKKVLDAVKFSDFYFIFLNLL